MSEDFATAIFLIVKAALMKVFKTIFEVVAHWRSHR